VTIGGNSMTRNVLETLLGAVVLLVAIAFLTFAYRSSQLGNGSDGYELVAKFDRVDGLDNGGDVRISGIKVGTIIGQQLDPATFRAEVRFSVRNDVELPLDTSAAIVSSGLLGGKYLSLEPGGEIDMLAPGGEITLTQSSVRLEDLIGQLVFSGQGGGGGQGGSREGAGNSGQSLENP
jgi:phospholipid/cholesterol/gamma-HCH transport system substrate-binding protein